MLLFFPFGDEKQLLSVCPSLYPNKLWEQKVQDVVNRNKIKFQPYDDLVDQIFSQNFNENPINNQVYYSQIENGEPPGAEYPNENDPEDTKFSAFPNFAPQILPDHEIVKGINYLNSKQREVFSVVYTWAKDYVKYDEHDVAPMHIFLSGIGGIGQSHLVKVI